MTRTIALDLHKRYAEIGIRQGRSKITRRRRIPATVPAPERELLAADLRTIDFLTAEIETAERSFAQAAHGDADIRRLMTIPGISFTSATALKAAIGDIQRFPAPGKLAFYFGLNPAVYQSGQKAYTGHISRRGRSHARSVCVEVAHQLVRTPGPFHAFFQCLERRKPYNVAITAVARKLVVLVWRMLTEGEDYRYSPPARTREKLNRVHHLATGERAPRDPKAGPAPDRAHDRDAARQAEAEYRKFITERFGPSGPAGVEHPNRTRRSRKKTYRTDGTAWHYQG